MSYKEYARYELDYNFSYESWEKAIDIVVKKFDATILEFLGDSYETIYCDILIDKKHKICLHHHYMIGLDVIALTKDSVDKAKEIAEYLDKLIKLNMDDNKED